MMIVIIDIGMGNLNSISNMLKKIGIKSTISSEPKIIDSATKLILPGVGSFDKAIMNLSKQKLLSLLDKKVIVEKTPILGICLGMQLFTKRSEEGTLGGLGWIDAETVRFNFEDNNVLKVPHMGWNTVNIKKDSCLYQNNVDDSRFYFVHSYYVRCNNNENIVTTTYHGFDFCSSLMKDNIYGVQYHPEKSHKFGMNILKNFVESC